MSKVLKPKAAIPKNHKTAQSLRALPHFEGFKLENIAYTQVIRYTNNTSKEIANDLPVRIKICELNTRLGETDFGQDEPFPFRSACNVSAILSQRDSGCKIKEITSFNTLAGLVYTYNALAHVLHSENGKRHFKRQQPLINTRSHQNFTLCLKAKNYDDNVTQYQDLMQSGLITLNSADRVCPSVTDYWGIHFLITKN
ncbi:hypothetical protein QTP88_015013 [Uroleucon formosanum]